MPIVDIECVRDAALPWPEAQPLADALGRVFASPPGRTWVRLRRLDALDYAENETPLGNAARPVFVTVLQAHPPEGDTLAAEVRAVTDAVAQVLGCEPERVHVQYSPPAAGRHAFGGRLVG